MGLFEIISQGCQSLAAATAPSVSAMGIHIVIALAIATLKASLVVLFFMHARYSPGRTHLVIICALFWLAIMLALTLSDYSTRTREARLNILNTIERTA